MKFTTRELVLLAIFGALWGLVEISLGAILHAFNIPLTGVLMAAISLIIALVGRLYVPKRGATLFIGVIAMILKLFSVGSVVLGPMVGILAEALIAEVVLSLSGSPSRWSFLLAGCFAVLWSLFHPFFTGLLFFGRALVDIWESVLSEGTRLLGLDAGAVLWIVLLLVAIRLVIGAAAGWLAWEAGKMIQARTGSRPVVNS